jgi:hypothetical protein
MLLRALAVVCILRLALWILPFRTLRSTLQKVKVGKRNATPVSFLEVKKTASTVRRASRYVPAASCLTQALATQLLLTRMGVAVILRIGVAKGINGKFEAHAWLESHGRIIIGKSRDLHRYTVLSRLEEVSL